MYHIHARLRVAEMGVRGHRAPSAGGRAGGAAAGAPAGGAARPQLEGGRGSEARPCAGTLPCAQSIGMPYPCP